MRNRELDELYASISIRWFGVALIAIFVPIYFLDLGYSLFSIMIFYVVWQLTHVFLTIPAGKFSSMFGLKHCIALSTPFIIVFYVLLYSLDVYNWPLNLLGVIAGISSVLFWVGYQTDFARISDKGSVGRELGMAEVFISIFKASGPILGGVLIVLIGFKALFAAVCLIFVASAMPLFFTKDCHIPVKFSLKNIFRYPLRDYAGYFARGIAIGPVSSIIWPLFIFLYIVSNYESLGSIVSLGFFASLIASFLIGKFTDLKHRLVLKMGGVFSAFLWAIRTTLTNVFQVVIIDTFFGVIISMVNIPFNTISYEKARKGDVLTGIMFREIMINIGGSAIFLLFAYSANYIAAFWLAAGSSLLLFVF